VTWTLIQLILLILRLEIFSLKLVLVLLLQVSYCVLIYFKLSMLLEHLQKKL